MDAAAVIQAISAGICLYAGILHLLIGLRGRFWDRTHLHFAVASLLWGTYSLDLLMLYAAVATGSLAWYVFVDRVGIAVYYLAFIFVFWFIATYTRTDTGVRLRRVLWIITGAYALISVLCFVLPYPWVYTDIKLTDAFPPDIVVAPWYSVEQVITLLLVFAYSAYCIVRQVRRGERNAAMALGVAVGIYLVAILWDYGIEYGLTDTVFMAQYGFVAFIVVMSLRLSNETIKAMRESRRLSLELEHRVEERIAELSSANQQLQQEIREREQAQDALRESQKRYQFASELSSDLAYAFRVEPDGTLVREWMSQTLSDITGLSSEEVAARGGWVGLIHPDDQPAAQQHMQTLLSGQPHGYELRIVTKDGAIRWVHDNGHPVWDAAQGRVIRIYGAARDITERKQAEDLLRESEQEFRALYQGIPVPVYAWQRCGEDLVLVDHNDAAAVITNAKITDFLGMTATAMYPDRPDIVEDLSRCFVEKTSIQREMAYQFITTGESKILVVKYAFVPPDLVLVHTEDITERKRAEEEASYERDLMQTLLDNIPDYVYFKDRDRRFVRVSRSFRDLFKHDPVDIIGKVDEELFPPEIAEETANDDRHVLETGTPLINKEEGSESIGGEEHWMLTTKFPWYDEAGNIIGLFGLSREITERRRTQIALRERTRELGKRVKELDCLFGISALTEQPGISLEGILQGTVDLILLARQYPENTCCARIIVDGQEFRSDGFQETAWKQDSYLSVYGERRGSVEVYYREERPPGDEGGGLDEGNPLLDAIAERLSRVIERFIAEKARRRRVKELSALHHVVQTLAAVGDLPEALKSVAETVTDLFDVRGSYFAVPDAEDAELKVTAGFERVSGPYVGTDQTSPLNQMPIARQVLDEGQSVVLSDVQALSLADAMRASVGERGFHAFLLVPLKVRGAVIGLLIVGADQPDRAFTPDEVALAETIAGDVAAALENARLSEQARAAAVDAERQRLARELHDSATQSLYSLTLLSKGWEAMAAQGRLENPAASFQRLRQVGQQALKELRLLIHQLRPPILEEMGLVATLRQRLEAVEQRANVEARLLTQGNVEDLPDEMEEQLFHIAQEALNNALRHAAATEVIVRIEVNAGEVVLSVTDNGVGFDPTADSAGMGLTTMQERAAAIGGQMTVNSAPDQGTTVEIVVAFKAGGST